MYDLGFLPASRLDLTTGKLYAVYGITYGGFKINGNSLVDYLIIDDLQSPSWYPARLFEMVCPHLYGEGWCFNHLVGDNFVIDSILGYEQFATNPQYFDDLLLHDFDNKLFQQWKKNVDDTMSKATCTCNVAITPTEVKYNRKNKYNTENQETDYTKRSHHAIAKFISDDLKQSLVDNIDAYTELHNLLQRNFNYLDKKLGNTELSKYFCENVSIKKWEEILESRQELFIKIFEVIVLSIRDLKKIYPQVADQLFEIFYSKW
jgi:hypothetical protein